MIINTDNKLSHHIIPFWLDNKFNLFAWVSKVLYEFWDDLLVSGGKDYWKLVFISEIKLMNEEKSTQNGP